ncbi:PREDICTED: putative F-box protein At1g47730 [Camelina sativa]|uniref:F-box protein At1g47730 n=1 Tax=Camelina sativa TaxID=90675 RepID=A0ABM0SL83_CAMSA|nr:PREDICTED: putative F-box protein At1g47730 [Camelina sativa]
MSYASTEDTYVLTLRAGESWRQIIDIPKCFLSCKGICINGILFIVGIDGKGKKILSFDVRTENFKIIQTHSCMLCDDEVEPNPSLVSYKGKLAWVISESTSYRLWVLEDTEKAEWSCQDFHIPFSLEDPVVKDNYFLSDVTEDGEFIYVSVSWQDKEIYVSYYDPKRKTHTRRIKIEHLDEDDDFWLRNGSCRDDWKFLGTLTNHIGNLMPLNTFPTCPPSGARLNKYMCTKVNAG